jgi:8-oxo-dGTP diphosphatase
MEKSKLTTLCYIEKDGAYLMLHRVSKKKDVNKDKWIGIGGHFEEGESPEECLLREAKEETGLTLTSYRFRGIVTFTEEGWGTEYMCLYTADSYEGTMTACDEGTLEWVKKEDVLKLNLWEGDKIFLGLLSENAPFFSLKLSYRGEMLTEAVLDGKTLSRG